MINLWKIDGSFSSLHTEAGEQTAQANDKRQQTRSTNSQNKRVFEASLDTASFECAEL